MNNICIYSGRSRTTFATSAIASLVFVWTLCGSTIVRPIEAFADPASQQAAGVIVAPTPATKVREIFVPESDLNVIIEAGPQRVYLPRQEYEELLKKAKQTPGKHPPIGSIAKSASYNMEISDGRVRIRGELVIEILDDGLQAISLPMFGVGIRTAMLDGQPASLGLAASPVDPAQPRNVTLFVEGRGERKLQLELTTVLTTSAAQQMLDFQIPHPSSSRWQMTVPGNVEVKSGSAVVSRKVDEAAGVTRFELLPNKERTTLTMSLNNRQLLQQRVVVTNSVMIDELTEAYERLHATVSSAVLHGATDRFRFELPAGFEVTEVSSPLLARWSVKPDSPAVLEVVLREATTQTVVINITAGRSQPARESWQFPRLKPLDVAGQSAVLGVVLEDRLSLQKMTTTGLVAIDTNVLDSAVKMDGGSSPPVRSVGAFYAPHADFDWSAQFDRPENKLSVTSNVMLSIGMQRLKVSGGWTLHPDRERLFEFSFQMPEKWKLTSLTTADGQKLPFDAESLVAPSTGTRVHARFPKLTPEQVAIVYFEAESIPSDWSNDWSGERTVEFPVISVENSAKEVGAIAVQMLDDLQTRPDALTGLTPLDNNEKQSFGLPGDVSSLAYRFEGLPYSAKFICERPQAITSAIAYNFLRVETNRLTGHYEMVFDVRQSRVRKVAFRLPATTPSAITVQGRAGTAIREYNSEVKGDYRVWTVLLSDERSDNVRLIVDFQQPIDKEEQTGFALPVVEVDDVAFQSATVAVEGGAELDIDVSTKGRRIDVGELVDAEYQVGKRLLGVFEFVSGSPSVTIDVARRPAYGLPAALVERAELDTIVSVHGTTQNAARYLLRTKATYLEVSVPTGAELWSVSVDGKPALPQRIGDHLAVSLPPSGNATRDLQLVYAMPATEISVGGDLALNAPTLYLKSDSGGEQQAVPNADLKWTLVLPSHHSLVSFGGSVFVESRVNEESPVRKAIQAIYYCLGGSFRAWRPLTKAIPVSPYFQNTEDEIRYYGKGDRTFGYRADASRPMPAASEPAAPPAPAAPPLPKSELPTPEFAKPVDELKSNLDGRKTLGADDFLDAKEESGIQQDLRRESARQSAVTWAMQGKRSLMIDLEKVGEQIVFRSLGANPVVRVTVVDVRRFRFFGWALAALVIFIGVVGIRWPVNRRVRFVVSVAVLAAIIPPVVELLTDLNVHTAFSPVFFAAILLIPGYLLIGALRYCRDTIRDIWRPAVRSTATVLLVGIGTLSTASIATAQPAVSPSVTPITGTVIDVKQLGDILPMLSDRAKVTLPDDAIIVPYDEGNPKGIQSAERVLVPYAKYLELWKLANPDKQLDTKVPPARFAFAATAYDAKLAGDEYLLLTGKLQIDVFVDGQVEVPLALQGGVLAQATVDGQPARIRVVDVVPAQQVAVPQPPAQPPSPQNVREKKVMAPPPGPMVVLLLDGKGRKQFEIAVRFRLTKTGGWRQSSGQLPSGPAAALTIAVPEQKTEVRLAGVADKSNFETKQDNETIETALVPGANLSIQWRPRITEAQVDQSLTARSIGRFDVREDGLQLSWTVQMEMRRSQREAFTLRVPKGYLVEKVIGPNVRGWEAKEEDDFQRLEVTLLKAVQGQETLTLILSRRGAVGTGDLQQVAAPFVVIPDAALHQGQFIIRRGVSIDARILSSSGVSRADVVAEPANPTGATVETTSVLGVQSLAAFNFNTTPFRILLAVEPGKATVHAHVRTRVRVAERETRIESQVSLDIRNQPIHRIRISIPAELELERPQLAVENEWAVTNEDNRKIVTLYLKSGVMQTFSMVLVGESKRSTEMADVPLPRIDILDVARQEGELVVQTDPAYDVTAAGLVNCDPILVVQTHTWLNDQHRATARLAFRYSYDAPDYAGTLKVTARKPKVTARTVTNVRVTNRVIEDTLLLDFTIVDAGIREVSFEGPAWLRESRIRVPLLRQKSFVNLDDGKRVRVRLQLQDDVMGSLRVLVENERLLTDQLHEAAIPVIKVEGSEFRIDHRYVTLESGGRDEVMIEANDGLEALTRQQKEWQALAGLLGAKSNITQAYVIRESAASQRLAFRTRQRDTVQTAGASIGISDTTLVVDGAGTYRAVQSFKVMNNTEQFLEIELPDGATLWTALVAGEPVKPTEVPNAANSRRVRIPLIKTATGEADYSVTLKYGGQIGELASFRSVKFPLIRTININVAWSQVRLRLPFTHQWPKYAVGGTMQFTEDETDLTGGYMRYFNRQLELINQSASHANSFERARLQQNLKQLNDAINSYQGQDFSRNPEVQKQLLSCIQQLDVAKKSFSVGPAVDANGDGVADPFGEIQKREATVLGDNRDNLNDLFNVQGNSRAKNVESDKNLNFTLPPVTATNSPTQPNGGDKAAQLDSRELNKRVVDEKWFLSNSLKDSGKEIADKAPEREDSKKKVPPAKWDAKPQAGKAQAAQQGDAANPGFFNNKADLDSVQQLEKARGEQVRRNRAVTDGEQAQKYARRLQESAEQQLQAQVQNESAPAPNSPAQGQAQRVPGGMGGMGFGGGAVRAIPADRGQITRGAMAAGQTTQAADLPTLSLAVQPPVPASGLFTDGVSRFTLGRELGLASLDVEIPQRGVEYLFTAPRGDGEITAVPIQERTVHNGQKIVWLLGACVLGWIAYRAICWVWSKLRGGVRILVVGLLGLISLFTGQVPLLGIGLLIAAAAMLVRTSLVHAGQRA